jgi:hypothetical protein
VQAAAKWIKSNWTLTENPGADASLGEKARYQGLFHYYVVLAQALDVLGESMVEVDTKDGTAAKVDWRRDLKKQLESLQRDDGTWRSDKSERWQEGNDLLCSCFALLALERCR